MKKKRKKRRRPAQCPCGLDATYGACCGRFHRDFRVAETPAELMRSRYAAYARGAVDYIVETTDPGGEAWQEPVAVWREEIRKFGREATFLGVEILDASVDGERGEVRFLARLRTDGEDASFEERSVFVRRDGCWLYKSGVTGPASG